MRLWGGGFAGKSLNEVKKDEVVGGVRLTCVCSDKCTKTAEWLENGARRTGEYVGTLWIPSPHFLIIHKKPSC